MTQLEQQLEHGLAGFPGSVTIAGAIKAGFQHLEERIKELEGHAGLDKSYEAPAAQPAARAGGPRSYADQVKDIAPPAKPAELTGPTPAQVTEAEAWVATKGYSPEAAAKLVAEHGATDLLAAKKVETALADPSRTPVTSGTHTS